MADLDGNTEITEIENQEEQEETKEIPEIDSKYRLILIAAQRSKQLQKGAHPRVEADTRKTKPTRIALEEIKKGKVGFDLTTEK
jgi:DNA-directed RNA polymerase omega subunit